MIVTFYSYKGGTGRTMAAANIACLLARAGRRVLLVDFDLEAPGVWRYFADFQRGLDRRPGLIELLTEQSILGERRSRGIPLPQPDWRQYITPVRIGTASVTLLTSGVQDDEYPARVLGFAWDEFFTSQDGGAFFERLREEWNREYDFVLIDSRTGITDIGGICTIALPDLIVPVFTANWQNLEGVVDTLRRAQRGRQELGYDRPPALVLPVLSRFESRTELESANEWLARAASMLGDCYADWLPRGVDPRLALERTKLPHVAYFGFGERLAVQLQGTSDPESLGYAYNTVARLIDSRLRDAPEVILGTPEPGEAGGATRLFSPPVDSWFAAVYDDEDTLLGGGVIIDGLRVLVATQVLRDAASASSGLRIAFPRVDNRLQRDLTCRATVTARGHRDRVSLLTLLDPPPPSVRAAPLDFSSARELVGRRWWAFGFPTGDRLGAEATGTVGAALAYGSIRLDGGGRMFWGPGINGAPVWSPDQGAVVAIALSAYREEQGAAVTLAEVAADLPDANLAALAVAGTGAGLDSQRREQLIDALARVFTTRQAVQEVVRQLALPDRVAEDFARYSYPALYWEHVVTELENGIIPNGVSSLVQAAAAMYPGHQGLREVCEYLGDGGGARPRSG